MAVVLKIQGNSYDGATTNISNYTVQEDSTPLAINDSSGGVGNIRVEIDEDASATGSRLLYGSKLSIEDGTNGLTYGRVNGLTGEDGVLNIDSVGALSAFAVDGKFAPYSGSLEGALFAYAANVALPEPMVVNFSGRAQQVVLPGWEGNVWDKLKELAAAYQFEVALVSNRVIVRDLRETTVSNARVIRESWTVAEESLARKVKVHYYNNTWYERKHVYPGYEDQAEIIEVKGSETKTFNLPVNASLTGIFPPDAQTAAVPQMIDYKNQNSVYSIIDKDDQPVVAGEWSSSGGFVRAQLGEDGKSVDVTVRGMNEYTREPFRLAAKGFNEEFYSTLRLVGRGVFYTDKIVEMPTGIDPALSADEYGVEVQNTAISSYDEAMSAAHRVANSFAGIKRELSITAESVNRRGVDGKARTFSFEDYSATRPGKTIADFNTTWAGKTFDEFNAYYVEQYARLFENQAFGNVAGARVRHRENFYRIRSATITPDQIQYRAEADATVKDFNELWAGKTFSEFNEFWADYTMGEFDMIPLHAPEPKSVWVDPEEPTREWVAWNEGGYGAGPYGGRPGEETVTPAPDWGYGDGGYGEGPYGGVDEGTVEPSMGYGESPYGESGYGE